MSDDKTTVTCRLHRQEVEVGPEHEFDMTFGAWTTDPNGTSTRRMVRARCPGSDYDGPHSFETRAPGH